MTNVKLVIGISPKMLAVTTVAVTPQAQGVMNVIPGPDNVIVKLEWVASDVMNVPMDSLASPRMDVNVVPPVRVRVKCVIPSMAVVSVLRSAVVWVAVNVLAVHGVGNLGWVVVNASVIVWVQLASIAIP